MAVTAKGVLGLAFCFTVGIVLQLLGCVLYNNWWPLLTGLMYVLVPMPYIFFGQANDYGSTSNVESGWVDAGKFLTGFSAVGSIAIPAVLAHSGIIETGALLFELAAVGVLAGTWMGYEYLQQADSYSYF
mmetsp:Transcript_29795/g.83954  ORF Transcript_29795/g.83954 Transcript_29795/m.83954 type:complete len:130 (-) Transcript_29795:1427-1816(-)|eukprot:CAMPEP_0117656062 /NCGR_PEP_ID=MMETSP0804-20121206/4607_1 /TAXON_ID=1074897 /ORGANISM="Tetraselmis astigmatica, Strain CCMP880" /LENGTH=129 /DNA_ID=CAMNT_0005462445 /DNA_START=267 /DNA_END=656 /DNA_ORIENTATION=+